MGAGSIASGESNARTNQRERAALEMLGSGRISGQGFHRHGRLFDRGRCVQRPTPAAIRILLMPKKSATQLSELVQTSVVA
jgi:hypothetical protein